MIREKIQTVLTNEVNPKISNNGKNKLASVLIIIYGDKPEILMTKKPITLTQHGGEISFPGGKISKIDENPYTYNKEEFEHKYNIKVY